MREILFRGKRIDNGEWVYGGHFADGKKHFIIIEVRYIPDTRDWDTMEYYEKNPKYIKTFIAVIPETVGQYTGMTDKNGKRIFEGDIVATRKSGIRTEKRKGYYGYDSEGYPQKLPGYNGFYEYKYTCQIDCYAEVKYDKVNGGFYLKGSDMFVSSTCNEVVGNIYDNQELINLNGVHKE